MSTPAIFHWSGGKDSAMALQTAIESGSFDIRYLVTTLSEIYGRVSMHGVREILLDKQASSIGIPLHKIFLPENAGMETYNASMEKTMEHFGAHGIQTGIFGDIYLEDLRLYREQALQKSGWQAVFPIWKRPTRDLLINFIARGFKAILVCVNASCLDATFAGRLLDQSLLDDLPPGVDPCGENGEFHSFVFEGPTLKEPISFTKGDIVHRTYPATAPYNAGFYFCDLLPGT